MNKIPIDIVLLPSEEIIEKAIELNQKINSKKIVLGKENSIPHISLCMAVIDETDLEKVTNILNSILEKYSILNLNISKLKVDSLNDNENWVNLKVEKSNKLQSLHEDIINNLRPFLTNNFSKEIFTIPNEINDTTIMWASNYLENSSFNNFSSHISLGIGETEEKNLDINFTSKKIAICKLGNYCSCEKILKIIN